MKYYIMTKTTQQFPTGYILQNGGLQIADSLPCDGGFLDKVVHAELYKAIGDSWGATDTTFRIPKMTGILDIKPVLIYEDWWETRPCKHCHKIFADDHDRTTWWCRSVKGLPIMRTYRPMDNLEYLEYKRVLANKAI